MGWLQSLAAEFAITLADGTVWLSIGQALLFGAVCLLFGTFVARIVGLLESDAPAGETIGVGLASGLLVLAAWWAAIASGGRSSFTPVAVGFALAIALGVVRRRRSTVAAEDGGARPPATPGVSRTADRSDITAERLASRSARRWNLLAAILGGALFVVALALLYGSTLTLSPRDGVQPLEFNDGAFYSILGADLARTGTETIYSPSGFSDIDGLPVQTWYHWGELWLASAAITIFGTTPVAARHFVVLPLLLLAAAALTGTVVRRMTGSASGGAFLFGFLACLFLAPMPLIAGPFFGSFARGLFFGITSYGIAAVAVLFALHSFTALGRRTATWALPSFAGSAAAFILPAHLVIAALALVGIGSVWALRIGQSLVATRRLPGVSSVWRRTFMATGIAIAATFAWGLLTGHGVGGSGPSPSVSPFNASWRESVVITTVCSGAFFAIAVAWLSVRKEASMEADLYVGTAALLLAGALVWGARLDDFIMVHMFFAAIVVFATPAAAVAVWSIWLRLCASGHRRLAIAVLVLCVTQLEIGVVVGVARLQDFGPGRDAPVPLEVMATINALPADAKLAYACQPFEEVSFWDARLLGVDARTGRRIVPVCFQAQVSEQLIGAEKSADIRNPTFQLAPQRTLYPDAGALPSAARVVSFLKDNGIDYIYVDAQHPNSLVPDAIPIATSGQTQVLRIP